MTATMYRTWGRVRAIVSRRLVGDSGMSTAEYAVGTVAAVAFAAVLYKVVTSSAVMSALSSIIRSALSVKL
ncbi:MAG: DUF4244 domain-containing protein [Mycobacteriales bacterium]